ncbi:MAG: AbrB/MazE/SpoVT family DNA-binding domain-containing protein [Rhodoferax sp.]
MRTATMATKGQITIPAEVRQALQVDAGDRIEFVEVVGQAFEPVSPLPQACHGRRVVGPGVASKTVPSLG